MNMVRALAIVLWNGVMSGVALSATADWPEFRGPGGQGISMAKDVPIKWSAEENIAWKVDLPGTGWSSPILVDGRLFLTAAVPVDGGKVSAKADGKPADKKGDSNAAPKEEKKKPTPS